MIAVDTNVLVYAHRTESPFHAEAKRVLGALAEGSVAWALPWPCIHEFLAVVTNFRVFKEPSSISFALSQVSFWLSPPTVQAIGETPPYMAVLQPLLLASGVTGPKVHDARIAAICLSNGVTELWSADRDFSRFSNALRVVNPF